MIVDTSAVISVLFGEEGSERYALALAEARRCRMSVVSFVEATMVLEGREGVAVGDELDALLEDVPIELAPVTVEQAQAAREAWRRFGKGNHPAALNFGDCFVYALAKATREPLLYKGDDFALTDIAPA